MTSTTDVAELLDALGFRRHPETEPLYGPGWQIWTYYDPGVSVRAAVQPGGGVQLCVTTTGSPFWFGYLSDGAPWDVAREVILTTQIAAQRRAGLLEREPF
jgi:hypothetical protein